MRSGALLFGAVLAATAAPAAAEPEFARLEGHGGPVRSVAVSPGGDMVLTASFDNSAGLWELASPPRLVAWLEGHQAAVNDVVFVGEGRALSTADDFAMILWDLATGAPIRRMEGHRGKVMAAAASPDGTRAASASWDGTIGIWDLGTGAMLARLEEHDSNVNDVLFTADGQGLYSASYDGTVRLWDLASGTSRVLHDNGFGVNVIAVDETAGWLAFGGLDGTVKVLELATGEVIADLGADRRPVLAMALSPDRRLLAIGDGKGYIQIVRTDGWIAERDFHAVARGPVWALAFTAGSDGLISAGLDDFATIWPLSSAESVPDAETPGRFQFSGELSNGARQFARKCAICHSLDPDGRRRAGPTLFGLFGRPAGTVPGYAYSDALDGAEIVWGEESINLLFDLGPALYTPGSKMPVQRITGAEDRADLIAFLREATKPGETDR